jgi:hypothetical protein
VGSVWGVAAPAATDQATMLRPANWR